MIYRGAAVSLPAALIPRADQQQLEGEGSVGMLPQADSELMADARADPLYVKIRTLRSRWCSTTEVTLAGCDRLDSDFGELPHHHG
jgi:hypothetical protein